MDLPKRIRVIGITALAAGFCAALIIYATAKPDTHVAVLGVDVLTKRDTLELERMGGEGYVLFHDFMVWFASLWHGQRLAYTVGVLALGGFVGSRWLADFLLYSTDVDETKDENTDSGR
jgi:hypothetical protein